MRPQGGDPGLDRGAAIRERDRRGCPVGESEPPFGICRPARQRAHPGSKNGERGVAPQLVIAEPPQPLLQGLDPAVVVDGQGKGVDQARDGVRLTRSVPVDDRRLVEVVGDAPGHRPTVEFAAPLRLAALELVPQQLAEQVVVAIPLASPVERHHEAVRTLERLERVCRARRLEHGVAEPAGHPVQHRGVLEEVRLGRRQPGQELEAEVVGHEPVVAGEARDARRAWRPGLQRQRREVQAGGPALRPLGQLGELARVELDPGRFQQRLGLLLVQPEVRHADARAPIPAPASGQAAGAAPLGWRSRSESPAGTYRNSSASTSIQAGLATACRSSSTSTSGRSSAASALPTCGTRIAQLDPPGPDNASNTSGGSGSTR